MINSCDVLDILSDKKVLYAEDEAGIRKNVAEILELFFQRVVAVEDEIKKFPSSYSQRIKNKIIYGVRLRSQSLARSM